MFCLHISIFCLHVCMFYLHVGMFCPHVGMFCLHVGVFCLHVGVFCLCVAMVCLCVGMFWLLLANTEESCLRCRVWSPTQHIFVSYVPSFKTPVKLSSVTKAEWQSYLLTMWHLAFITLMNGVPERMDLILEWQREIIVSHSILIGPAYLLNHFNSIRPYLRHLIAQIFIKPLYMWKFENSLSFLRMESHSAR